MVRFWSGRLLSDRRSGLAAFYWFGLANLLLRDAGLELPDAAGSVLTLLGSLLARLGFALGRPPSSP